MAKNRKSRSLFVSSIGLLAATSVVAPLSFMTSCANEETTFEFAAYFE